MPNFEEVDTGRRSDENALTRLEETVGRALREIRHLRERARQAEERVHRMEELLGGDGEEIDPRRMVDRLRVLEEENGDLHERLSQGRDAVDRLLARIRFLEEQT